jgi:CRISPR-associated endonuclease/helicase Cas3
MTDYFHFWGKARPESSTGARWHPLPYHCLDVAAVGQVLLARDERLRHTLAKIADLPERQVVRWVPFVLALHDLGKFSVPFQCQVPDLANELLGWSQRAPCELRHDSLGYLLFADAEVGVASWLWREERAPVSIDGERVSDARDLLDVLSPWMRASCGHHGRPPQTGMLETRAFPQRASEAAMSFVHEVLAVLQPGPLAAVEEALKRSSWLVAGVAVLADWIGSNQSFFRYHPPVATLADYWKHTLITAGDAVEACGVLPAVPSALRSPREVFPHVAEFTPLQRLCYEVSFGEGPQLFLLEDVTGSGKTEAALLLAHRMMAAGRVDGLYFALPTMATANGMYSRVEGLYERLFAEGEPSLVLAHGKTALYEALRRADRDIANDGVESATQHCAAWLADTRKKALLASVGVGTIDQALLSVLPSKHGALRTLGLHRKVLIVDEVHACDAYMTTVLRRLLEFQASLGGSAILLSATLPLESRQSLIGAFQKPLGAAPRAKATDYPLLTSADAGGVRELPCDAAPRSRRQVGVTFLDSADQAIDLLRSTADEGGCAVWIRNTVTDAIQAFERLAGRPDVHLFHARFVVGDRQRIEADAFARFGKSSGPAERRGQILISTQVVEQSLDLDFDVMVSDLAPIELLLQRAGRLHRHARARDGSTTPDQPDGRGDPVLHVLAPRWDDDPRGDWLQASAVGRTRFVYENPAHLWATQRVLRERKAMVTPDESRFLVESVFAAQAPEGLARNEGRATGKGKAAESLGLMNALPFEQGYVRDAVRWLDDTRTPTRLGDETTTVRLCVLEGGRPVPFFRRPDLDLDLCWQLSEASIRATLVAGPVEGDPMVEQARQVMSDGGRWCVPVMLAPSADGGTWEGRASRGNGGEIGLKYGHFVGLLAQVVAGSAASHLLQQAEP